MPRKKRESAVLKKAQKRLDGVRGLDPKLDLGGGLTVASYGKSIAELQGTVTAYNRVLSEADAMSVRLREQEKEMRELSDRVLSGVAACFNRNSEQYVAAGGKRKVDRKRTKKGAGTTKRSKKQAPPIDQESTTTAAANGQSNGLSMNGHTNGVAANGTTPHV
jgi:hypothetical protein